MLCGGIDIGGTKIEARLFDGPDAKTVKSRRVPTPAASFDDTARALADQVRWLEQQAGAPVPIGVSLAGLIDPETGESFTSNVPARGRSVGQALTQLTGRTFPIVNDCMAFAYSEANGGAAEGARVVVGLILGTGLGAGLCIDGHLPHRHAGLAVEVGHLGVSQRLAARHGLPSWTCGCGRSGCLEAYVSGTGISNLAEWKLGQRLRAEDLAVTAGPGAAEVMDIWADIVGECLYAIQVMLDPDCIILGGGVSNLPGVAEILVDSLARQRLGPVRPPLVAVAQHGDSSGARGAALIARDVAQQRH